MKTSKSFRPKAQQDFIWDKIIYANPTKPKETLLALDKYKPLVTYDNLNELKKSGNTRRTPAWCCAWRVANTGSQCELSNKFGCDPGEAVDLILAAFKLGLVVEGLSFHVGSQCTNFENFVQALNVAAAVMKESRERGHEIKILDIGGGFPAPYNKHVKPFRELARVINAEIDRLFAKDIQILAEPGRFLVATAATSVARVIGKAVRDGKTRATTLTTACITRSAESSSTTASITLKAFKKGKTEICAVFGQTCDGLDTISQSGGTAGSGNRRPGLFGKHRRLQQRLGDLVQRLPAGEGARDGGWTD